ncbi:alpha/beta hydrolase [Cereibacter changlensis]|uniref:Alpha/beta hydrolase n=1 Tax=Cereibacter changlensis TaxID=402884 RepID=A0A4V5NPL7_9RHOB|nr:alpha/beta hydrolase [Cereibacter changlensis]TKA97187.1 alpha/beta hydrolase [Cereibacter changlensis]
MTLPKLVASLVAATVVLGGCAAAVDTRATRREALAEQLYPPTGQLLQVNGRTVHAHVEGQGPDLVLIHGASGNTRDFTFRLVDQLKGRYRVIAFDRPGMGWSDDMGPEGLSPLVQADVLRAAADQLGVKNPLVLGHSYGGSVALAWGLRDPGDTAGLVIVSGASMPWPGGLGALNAVTASDFGGATIVPLLTAYVAPERTEPVVEAIFAPQAAPEGYAEYIGIGLSLRRDSFRTNAKQLSNLKPYLQLMMPNYSKLPMPVEIVHGTGDTIVPYKVHGEPLSKLIPGAHLTLLPDIGHMPQHVAAPAVIAAIDRAAARAGLR